MSIADFGLSVFVVTVVEADCGLLLVSFISPGGFFIWLLSLKMFRGFIFRDGDEGFVSVFLALVPYLALMLVVWFSWSLLKTSFSFRLPSSSNC